MKKMLSFEFWQKFGKCLMVVIAVMPAAGLMVSIGNSLPLISDAEWLARVGNIIAQIGWGIIGNLHLLFALAIGGSWANERAGGAFAAGLAFILINLITGNFFGVKLEMLADPNAHVSTVFAGVCECTWTTCIKHGGIRRYYCRFCWRNNFQPLLQFP